MGMEKYSYFVRRCRNTLTYDPGWSEDNKTGSWRSLRPVKNKDKCNNCSLCWLYCPEGCISRDEFEIDYTYCKGCGICAEECPTKAIVMEREAE
jgi:2-oxoacid:acceptor oxidoreductase delta subunit (pyruvate/2-ketoisovalerate family)